MEWLATLSLGHHEPVCSVCLIKEHCLLASADQSGLIIITCLRKRKQVCQYKAGAQVLHLTYYFDDDFCGGFFFLNAQLRTGSLLVFKYYPTRCTITAGESLELVKELPIAEFSFCRHVIKSGLLVGPRTETSPVLIDIKTFDYCPFSIFSDHQEHGALMAVDLHDSRLLACGYEDGSVIIFDITNPVSPTVTTQLKALEESVTCLCFIPHNNWLVIGGAVNKIAVWMDDENLNYSKVFRNNGIATCVYLSKLIYTGGWDGRVRVFKLPDTDDSNIVEMMSTTDEGVYDTITCMDIGILQDAVPGKSLLKKTTRLLVTGSKDCHVNLWSIA